MIVITPKQHVIPLLFCHNLYWKVLYRRAFTNAVCLLKKMTRSSDMLTTNLLYSPQIFRCRCPTISIIDFINAVVVVSIFSGKYYRGGRLSVEYSVYFIWSTSRKLALISLFLRAELHIQCYNVYRLTRPRCSTSLGRNFSFSP